MIKLKFTKGSAVTRITSTSRARGMTLIEILIVIAITIVAITIAMTTYDGIRKNNRQLQGEGLLLDIMQRQEHFYSSNTTYTTAPDEIDYDPTEASPDNKIYYAVEASPCPGQTIAQCVRLVGSPVVAGDSFLSISSVSDTLVVSDTAP